MGSIIRGANYDEKKISLTACENKCDATLKKETHHHECHILQN